MDRPAAPNPYKAAAENFAKAGIERFARLVESATVEEVDEPTGRKYVEVEYQSPFGVEMEDGKAIGIYYDPGREDPSLVKIDWVNGERTTLNWDSVQKIEESEYHTDL